MLPYQTKTSGKQMKPKQTSFSLKTKYTWPQNPYKSITWYLLCRSDSLTVANTWGQAKWRKGLLWGLQSCCCGRGGGGPEEKGVCGVDCTPRQSGRDQGVPAPSEDTLWWSEDFTLHFIFSRFRLSQEKQSPEHSVYSFVRHVSKPNIQMDQLDVFPMVLLPCSPLATLPPPSSHGMETLILFCRMESPSARTAKGKQHHL